jgi:hypothetical protein
MNSLPSDSQTSVAKPTRPRDGKELLALLLTGETVEIPSRMVMHTLQWLDQAAGKWKISVSPSSQGYQVLTPDSSNAAVLGRDAVKDEVADIAAEQRGKSQ